ncbi:MAG: hypothetical protein ACMZI0_09515 [Symbiopectobacterium sp.]|uniref:hypothetical protein n=1 Tax=Symbiopectobacterium sp. TaxID=2952789 RepID=UPI0039EC5EED
MTDFLQADVTGGAPAAPVLFLSVGEWEQSLERWELRLPEIQREALRQHRRQRRMVDGVRELAWRLQDASADKLEVSFFVHAGQSHQSVPLLSLQQALYAPFSALMTQNHRRNGRIIKLFSYFMWMNTV